MSGWLRSGAMLCALLIGFFALPPAALAGNATTAPVPVTEPAPALGSIAFYYGSNPPLDDLQAFDIAVVDPDHVTQPERHARTSKDGSHALFAYVALGEVQPSRPYYRALPSGVLRTDNAAWGSKVIDQAAPGWHEYFLDQVIAPLWQQGWRGFFIDTLDSYQLFAKTDAERGQQTAAMVATLRELKRRFPEARLILNRGFELLPELAPLTYAVAAESLYQGFDAGKNQYRPVGSADRDWLMAQLRSAHDTYHLPVISIEYVDPSRADARAVARTTAAQVRQLGFVPWVADGALASVGVSNVEVIPRTVLVLLDNLALDVHYSDVQRYLGMPMNYLGLRYEFVDLHRDPLPAGVLTGRYAGIVSWLDAGVDHPGLAAWFKRRIDEGLRIAVFDTFGFPLENASAAMLGLKLLPATHPDRLDVLSRDAAIMDFEVAALPDRARLEPVQLNDAAARSLLRLRDERGVTYDAAALTAWGGYALAPYTARSLPQLGADRWVLQPLRFLQAALQLPSVPMPDVTTEGGQRMLMAHVDADGFASRAELPGAPFASAVMSQQILQRYRIPTAVSVIEGEVSAQGVYPALSAQLEPIARQIFALPYVEAASHSYSHPFNWAKAMAVASTHGEDDAGAGYGLPLPGYRFTLQREVQGSIGYINARLMPANKKAGLFLWSGNCVPPAAAIAETRNDGLLNMNGGDTLITGSNTSWTAIAPQGVRKDGEYQVFAPNQNENVYTNNWSGPFYGFDRVLETYRLTDQPYRFKPVDIYYHVYSASKPASLAALNKVYQWATAQRFTRVYPSQYIRKVMDFEATTVARDLATGELVIRTGTSLRTMRLPVGAPVPSLARSSGLAGVTPAAAGAYLTLGSAEARLSTAPETGTSIAIAQVNGSVDQLVRGQDGHTRQLDFLVRANERVTLTLSNAAGCSVRADGAAIAAAPGTQRYQFGALTVAAGSPTVTQQHAVSVRCL